MGVIVRCLALALSLFAQGVLGQDAESLDALWSKWLRGESLASFQTATAVMPVLTFHVGGSLAQANFADAVEIFDLDRDGLDEVVVGSPRESTPSTSDLRGRVRIFKTTVPSSGSAVWRTISNPDSVGFATQSRFGAALGRGDLNGDGFFDLFVGSPQASIAGSAKCGAVYVFFGPDFNAWRKVQPVVPETDANFGHWVNSGDFDGDGHLDLAVGSPDATASGGLGRAGVVDVWFGPDLAHSRRIEGPVPQVGADFGYRVVVSDFNRDGFDDLGVAATFYALGACPIQAPNLPACGTTAAVPGTVTDKSGRIFAFAGPHFEVLLDFPNPFSHATDGGRCGNGLLGSDLVAADVDGDGWPDLITGAEWDTVLAANYGHGSVWTLHGPDFVRRSQFLPTDPRTYGGFGSAIAVGDVDIDGFQDLVIGEFTRNFTGPVTTTCESGRVTILFGPDHTRRQTFDNPFNNARRRFGRRVRIGEIDGLAAPEIYVGAPFSNAIAGGGNPGSPTQSGVLHIIRL